jgi:hypothetical protein
MKQKMVLSFRIATLTALIAVSATAQSPAVSTKGGKGKPIPRTADGHPDLSGIWQSGGVSLYGETGEAVPGQTKQAGPRREPPPYKPEAAQKMALLAKDNRNDPAVHCFLLGLPRTTTWPMPFEIVQTPKKTIILHEAMRTFRIIPTDGKGHPKDLDPAFMGDSVGTWDGDTFVVDVIGFNDRTWLSIAGSHHSEQLHLVERWTRTPEDTLRYEVMAEDPVVFTKPWKVTDATLRHPPREDRVMEYECLDGNIDVNHIVPEK